MGALNLPVSGAVYLDANCIIYAVEKVAPCDAALAPLWQAAASGQVSLMSSELVALEVLVRPLRDKNARLEAAFRASCSTRKSSGSRPSSCGLSSAPPSYARNSA